MESLSVDSDEKCREIAGGMNASGFRLLESIVKTKVDANVLISPYSISSAFGLLASGAKGKTKEEILTALGIPDDPAILQRMAKALEETKADHVFGVGNQKEPERAKIAEVLSANSVWQGKDREGLPSTTLSPEYRDIVEKHFGGMVRTVDFYNSPDEAANEINAYVSEKTKRMIPTVLDPNDVDRETALMLVNSLYFKCRWQDEFDEADTHVEGFRRVDGSDIPVEMMNDCRDVQYFEDRDVKAIRLPYEDSRFSMVAILPREGLGWKGRIGTLVAKKFKDIIEKARWEEVTYVKLPKLDIDFELDLKDPLSKNGMPTALSEHPDLSGICEWARRATEPNSPYRYFVNKIIHKTTLQLDEEKTGAAAATAICFCAKGCLGMFDHAPPPPKYFYANRPFVLALYDGQTGLVLFAGVVNAPKAVDAPAGSWQYWPESEKPNHMVSSF